MKKSITKLLTNSFFPQPTNIFFPWLDVNVAQDITSEGQRLLKLLDDGKALVELTTKSFN